MVPETWVIFNQLTRLIARDDFTNLNRCECLRYYTMMLLANVDNCMEILIASDHMMA
jgi:hypothetical protein